MPYTLEAVFPPDRYDYVPKVAVFRTHRRFKNGKVVTVTKDDLEATAKHHNELFYRYGRASPFSKGHTLDAGPDGAEVPEDQQPDTVGAGVHLFVEKSPDPEDVDGHILYCTWAIPKDEKEEVLKNYCSISSEYYPSRHWVFPFSLLKSSAPELPDMPVIPLRYGVELQKGEELPYHIVTDNPFRYSHEKVDMNPDEMKDKKDDKDMDKKDAPKKEESPEMKSAKKDAEKGSVQDASDLAEIKEQLAQIMAVMPEIMQLVQLMKEEPEGDDLMKPDDKPAPDMGMEGKDSKPDEKDSLKDAGVKPVKFEMPSATNCNIPSFSKEKEDYAMNDEVVKYKNEVESLKAQLQKEKAKSDATEKVAKKLHDEYKKNKAKEHVADIESVCKYRSEKAREQDLEMLAKLDDDSAKQYVEMAKERYERKLPDGESVKEVAKYAVEQEPDLTAKTPEEAQERAMKIIASGLTREEFYKQLTTKK